MMEVSPTKPSNWIQMTMMAHWKISVWICILISRLLKILSGFDTFTCLQEDSRPYSELHVISTDE